MKGVQVVHVPDPGPFKRPPFHADINPTNYINPTVLLTDLAPNPTCKVVICGRTSPNIGSIEDVTAILDYLSNVG
jgi:hypothetical protein